MAEAVADTAEYLSVRERKWDALTSSYAGAEQTWICANAAIEWAALRAGSGRRPHRTGFAAEDDELA